MWLVVSGYLRKERWLDVPVAGARRAVQDLGHAARGRRRRAAHVAPGTGRARPGARRLGRRCRARRPRGGGLRGFVENRAAFIEAARGIKKTHLALSDAECAAPGALPGAHAGRPQDARAPPLVTDPTYKIEVGAGLVVFTLGGRTVARTPTCSAAKITRACGRELN